MNKLITILASTLIAAGLSFAQESSAKKSDNGVGAKIAFDYGTMFGFEEEDDNVDGNPSGFGFSAGIMGRVELVNNFYFTPEIDFSYMNVSHEYLGSKREYTTMDLELPILLRGVVAEKFYVTAGPQVNINLSNKAKLEIPEMEMGGLTMVFDEFEEKLEQTTLTFGIAAGAGYNIIEGLNVDFRFFMGLNELFPDVAFAGDLTSLNEAKDGYSMINMAGAKMMKFRLGLSYWFI